MNDNLLLTLIFSCTVIFFVGTHNLDLMFNFCLLGQKADLDCNDFEDRNLLQTQRFDDSYIISYNAILIGFLASNMTWIIYFANKKKQKS